MATRHIDPSVVGNADLVLDFITGLLHASTGHSIVAVDLSGNILLWNEGARLTYGYEPEEVVGHLNISALYPATDADSGCARERFEFALKYAKWEGPVRCRHKNGATFISHTVITTRRGTSGGINGLLIISSEALDGVHFKPVSDPESVRHMLTGAALHESDEHNRIITETAMDAIISIDEQGVIVSMNAATERIFGYRVHDMLGQELTMLIPESLQKLRAASRGLRRMTVQRHVVWEDVELSGRHKDGHLIPLEVSFGGYRRDGERLFTGIIRDITERKRADEKIRFLAQYDALTKLPNRVLLQDRVEHALALARRNQEKVAVLFLDLDDFKPINDSLGHQTGDQLLRMVSQRLRLCLREGDTVGRFGGDEFIICLPPPLVERDVTSVAEKILAAIGEPFRVRENELHIGASIGISLFPADGADAETLMRAADIAMYHVKERGRNNFQFFTPDLNAAAQKRLEIINQLHQALQRDEFFLVYQPQVELANGKIFAAEALIRWQQPDKGLILPEEFIKIAEETGLIVQIGEWALREACQQLKRWRISGYPDLRVAVNLSPEQFRHPGFPELVLRILHNLELPAAALDLEITEGVLMRQSLENIAVLAQLAGSGVQFAVDDFGTGYSNLAYLQRFPIDTIKIDRSFLDGLGQDINNSAIVTAIIAMAENLNLHIVAEGVETADQVNFLKNHGCLAAQGNFYHAPVSTQLFDHLLKNQATALLLNDADNNS